MPIHALLGATGSTGSAVLRYFLEEQPISGLELRICVRNKAKLLKSFPKLESTSAFKCSITEANLDDTAALQKCLNKAEIIYNCVSSNEAKKNVSTAQDAAAAINSALRELRKSQGGEYVKPVVLVNRSKSLNDEVLKHGGLAKSFVRFALWYCYDDIAKAVDEFKQASAEDVLLLICMDGPALHSGTKRTGHSLSIEDDEKAQPNLCFADLGAAFVEAAKRKNEFIGKGVIVSATGDVEAHWDESMSSIAFGLRNRIVGF